MFIKAVLFFVLPLVLLVCVVFTGIHLETGKGEHTGYVTAVETTGLFLKTERAYVKTNTQSSQEDMYCVATQSVKDELAAYAKSGTQVTVKYLEWFVRGFTNCSGEMAGVIYGVSAVN